MTNTTTPSEPQHEQRYRVTIKATGEVRDKHGDLVNTVEVDQEVEGTLEELHAQGIEFTPSE